MSDDDHKSERDALHEQWLATQRARPQARAMRTAGFAANKVVRPLARKHGKTASTVSRIARGWADYAGKFATLSKPVRLQGTASGRTLVVEALGPAATLIQADAGRILDRINARLGTDAVTALRVVQAKMKRDTPIAPKSVRGLTPTEEAELQSSLSGVADEGLRAALEQMGRNSFTRDD